MYQRDLTDILRDVVNGMSFPITVNSCIRNIDGSQTITACDIFYTQTGYSVQVNGNPYKISSFSYDPDTITLVADFTPAGAGIDDILPGDTFNLYPVYFFHGTPIATDTELMKIPNTVDKLPMIWLWDNFTEKELGSMDSVGREVDADLYFLAEADHDLQLTDGLYSIGVKPMRRLEQSFKNEILFRTEIFETENQTFGNTNYAKFGLFQKEKGSTKQLIGKNLTGVNSKIPLRIWKKYDCPCDSATPADTVGIGADVIGTTLIL